MSEKPKELYVRKSIGTGGDVIRELSEYQNPDNYYLMVEKSAYDEAIKYIRGHANNDNGVFDDDDRVKELRARIAKLSTELDIIAAIPNLQAEWDHARIQRLESQLKLEEQKFQKETLVTSGLYQKLEAANKALNFYAKGSYVSTPHEYHKNTKFDAGQNKRYPNQVGEYGTTAKEALKITEG